MESAILSSGNIIFLLICAAVVAVLLVMNKKVKPAAPPPSGSVEPIPPIGGDPLPDPPPFKGLWTMRGGYVEQGERQWFLLTHSVNGCDSATGKVLAEFGFDDNGTGPYDVAVEFLHTDPATQKLVSDPVYAGDMGPNIAGKRVPLADLVNGIVWYTWTKRPYEMATETTCGAQIVVPKNARGSCASGGCGPGANDPWDKPFDIPPDDKTFPTKFRVTIWNRFGASKAWEQVLRVIPKGCA